MSVEQDTSTLPEYPGEVVTAGSTAPQHEPAVTSVSNPLGVEFSQPVSEPVEVPQPVATASVDPEPEPVPVAAPDGPIGTRTPAQAESPRDETERLDPQPIEMKLVSGTEFELEPLKLRQFLRLLRIITRGAADVLDQAKIDFDNPDAFVQQFLGMVMFSIPEAEEETIDFIKSMIKPKNMTGDPNKDIIVLRELLGEIENPDLNDVITITQAIVEKEAEDLRALGKRLGAMFAVAQKMGATRPKPSPTPPTDS